LRVPGRNYAALYELAADRFGYVTTRDAEQLQIPAKRVAELAHAGLLERAAHGVYRFVAFPTSGLDQFMEATLWPNEKGVLSHATALDLHDLCDVNPARIHLTVPKAYRQNHNRQMPKLYELHRRDLNGDEQTLHEGIPIVTVHRAIMDGIEAHLRGDLVEQAIQTARRRGMLTRDQLAELERRRPPHPAAAGS
jgi:predicted transcriptional regulator of viral defense system